MNFAPFFYAFIDRNSRLERFSKKDVLKYFEASKVSHGFLFSRVAELVPAKTKNFLRHRILFW